MKELIFADKYTNLIFEKKLAFLGNVLIYNVASLQEV